MCEPIYTGVCNCPGNIKCVCACGICQKCGRRIAEKIINLEIKPTGDCNEIKKEV